MPKDWSVENVTIIFKWSRRDSGNCMLVKLMSVPHKLIESVIKDRITRYLDGQSLLKGNKHGFGKGKSCLINHLKFSEKANEQVDNSEVIHLSFQKAFEKLRHQVLLSKLNSHLNHYLPLLVSTTNR